MNNCCKSCKTTIYPPTRFVSDCTNLSCECHKKLFKGFETFQPPYDQISNPPKQEKPECEQSSSFTHIENCSGVHRGASCYPIGDIRGAVVGLTSTMLDNPDKNGIYHTSSFYNNLEEYFKVSLLSEKKRWVEGVKRKVFNLETIPLDSKHGIITTDHVHMDNVVDILSQELE